MMHLDFENIARLPVPDDNVAIATQVIPLGAIISYGDAKLTTSHTILVGHRFAVREIAAGQALLSWGQTFGIATRTIQPGEYVCNASVLKELAQRSLDATLPTEPNFRDDLEHYQFGEANFIPAQPLPRYETDKFFLGYPREGGRGVGTRNYIVLLGVTSLVAGFVRKLESQLQPLLADYPNVDGVVAVAHTEGGHGQANNQDLLLRTLAGFAVHPNVGAVLIVDYGHEAINNDLLRGSLTDYPLDDVLHNFMSLSASFEDDLAQGEAVVKSWLPIVNNTERSPQPLSKLKIALQCGGSDAFSGVSGNPLAAWVAKEVIQYGGSANLAETDELIGAESYILDNVRDAATVYKFLAVSERFKAQVERHGHSAEGNPSGGNKFRGLYNIYLKSLGAATKRNPDVPLDYVIDYSERMAEPGFYFMDSPGNDLESIAGQVAAGCNMIFFVTGNGSITNFPFVPTIKIVTTTERFELLQADMDINAGTYLDGTPLDELGAEMLNYTVDVASGELSVGEKAGHAQVQIWRNWQLTQPIELAPVQNITCNGKPIPIQTNDTPLDVTIHMQQRGSVITSDQVGLIMPTSLCSGQIARMCVEVLNQHPMLAESVISRFVTLTHTEGCGVAHGHEYKDTLLGYLGHPFVKHALLLEHGCEATHNAYFRQAMQARGYNPDGYGWASIQLDGGIQAAMQKMIAWFEGQIMAEDKAQAATVGLEAVRIAILTHGHITDASIFADLTRMIVSAGGTVMLSEQDALLKTAFTEQLGITDKLQPTIRYAQQAESQGLYIMAMPTHDWGETLTGLGASGVDLILAYTEQQAMPGHPMIPVLQVSHADLSEIDVVLRQHQHPLQTLLDAVISTLSGDYTPQVMASGNVNFQVTRGLLGVSL